MTKGEMDSSKTVAYSAPPEFSSTLDKMTKRPRLQPPTSAAPSSVPAWPRLPTLASRFTPLEITKVAPHLLTIASFFPSDIAQLWSSYMATEIDYTPPRAPQKGEATRTNYRFAIDDPTLVHRLWHETGLKELCESEGELHVVGKRMVGLNSNLRLYKYGVGSYFGKHYDDSIRVGRSTSEWTLLLYLTGAEDGVRGGGTAFYPNRNSDGIVVELRRGTLLLHRHGNECMLHEGLAVESGVKFVLRSDLMYTVI